MENKGSGKGSSKQSQKTQKPNNSQVDESSEAEDSLFGEEDSGGGPIRLGDAIKKVVSAGLGAAFMTEESIRSYLGDLRIPKEVMGHLLQGANRSKEELVDRVGNEMAKMLRKIDLVKEASKFVENHKFKISAEVEVIRKETSMSDKKTSEE